MLIRDVFSVPVFLLLLFVTYGSMWLYIMRQEKNLK